MPAPATPEQSPEVQISFAEDTELTFLSAAGSPLWSGLAPDDWKAYVEFDICHALPNIHGPEMHGRVFSYHPQVLAMSAKSLLHQQFNLGHLLKAYGHYKDRIIGTIVGVSFPSPPFGRAWDIPEKTEDAPAIKAVAAIWKIADGVDRFLGKHLGGKERQSVSIESISPTANYGVYDPGDRSIRTLEEAAAEFGKALWVDPKNGLLVGKHMGRQLALLPGGKDKAVFFRGVGATPTPAEKTAKIVDIRAEVGGMMMEAAMAQLEWEAGSEVCWEPIFKGLDAGRGMITEVIEEGDVSVHGTKLKATPADPVLRIKILGKALEVCRHSSFVKKFVK